jgi:uncharacterized membrane protein
VTSTEGKNPAIEVDDGGHLPEAQSARHPTRPERIERSSSSPPSGHGLAASYRSQEVRFSQGVLTDPKSLQEYETACPGSAQLILTQYFKQTDAEQEHRHKLERLTLEAEASYAAGVLRQGARGQRMALTVALVGLALVAWLAHTGQPVLAGVIGTLDLGGLVSVFIYGKRKQTEALASEENEPTSDRS